MISRATLAFLISSLFSSLCVAQGLPELGDVSAASLSEPQERTIGNRIMREIRVDPAYVQDPEVVDYLNSLGSRLLAVADPGSRKDLTFFAVRDDAVNAFALVGGHVGVFSGLILLTQNESELAGVVAHEVAHVLQRHQSRMAAGQGRAQLTSLAALALAILASRSNSSQGAQMTEAAITSAAALGMQSQIDYTREHEREADRVGLTLLERAGFDPGGMASFFERMLRVNRLNEFKGAPSYLRTHPLTTERIADMQDRVHRMPTKMVPDSFQYRLARARLRAASGTPSEAVTHFRALLADQTVLRPREDLYGLALALRRTRDFEGANKVLGPLRTGKGSDPAFEVLASELAADQGRVDESLETYRTALRAHPGHRSLIYGYLTQLLQAGRAGEALADLDQRLRTTNDDALLYELQSRAFAATGQRLPQHRAQAEAYYRRGNLSAAVDQLEIAVRDKSSDFYQLSSAESRLRELRSQLENERAAEKALKIS